jgi:transmembrane sensor
MTYDIHQMKTLFRKVLKGTASAAEQHTLRDYLEREKPDLQLLLPFEEWDMEEAGKGMTAEEKEVWIAKITGAKSTKRSMSFKRWIPYAAALLVGIAAFGLFKNRERNKTELVWTSVKTPRGKQSQVWLPDSSLVTLNAGSELRYPLHFEQNKREVYLSGEGFFQVRHNEAAPFAVYTPLVKVSVLGTSFNVQAYQEDRHIAVAVKTGKVKVVSNNDKHIGNVLLPGQQVLYNKNDHKVSFGNLDTAAVAQWRSRRINLEDMELDHILKVIGRTYDVQFHTDSPDLLHRKYSVTFYDMKLEEVLDKLAYLGTLEFSKKGNQIIFKEQP